MKKIKLQINDDPNLRFELVFYLDSLWIKICRKSKMAEWIIDYFHAEYGINEETDIHAVLEKVYDDFLAKKKVEDHWNKAFENAQIIEIKEKPKED